MCIKIIDNILNVGFKGMFWDYLWRLLLTCSGPGEKGLQINPAASERQRWGEHCILCAAHIYSCIKLRFSSQEDRQLALSSALLAEPACPEMLGSTVWWVECFEIHILNDGGVVCFVSLDIVPGLSWSFLSLSGWRWLLINDKLDWKTCSYFGLLCLFGIEG